MTLESLTILLDVLCPQNSMQMLQGEETLVLADEHLLLYHINRPYAIELTELVNGSAAVVCKDQSFVCYMEGLVNNFEVFQLYYGFQLVHTKSSDTF